jgi:hypothetical protein
MVAEHRYGVNMETDPDPEPSQAEPKSDLPDMGEPETRGGEPEKKKR